MKRITQNLKWLVTLLTMIVSTGAWAQNETGTIIFGSKGVQINDKSVEGVDDLGNNWIITTVITNSSFTQQPTYSQVGSSNKPATSITFTTTLPNTVTITDFSADFGGFNGTAGYVSLKVGDTEVGSGSLNAGNDVTVSSTSSAQGTVLTVSVTNIAKGVKCYSISYSYTTSGKPNANISWSANEATATLGKPFVAPTLSNTENLPITYSSNDPSVATINDGAVTLVGAGTTTITASFAGNDDYEVTNVSYTLTVNKQDVTLEFSQTSFNVNPDEIDSFEEPSLTITPSGLTVTYSSTEETVATVDAKGKVTILGLGSTRIKATFTETDTYNGATASYTINVAKTYKKANGYYALVTDASTLAEGDEIIFVYVDDSKKVAMSTTQNNNNRGSSSIKVENDATWYYNNTLVDIKRNDVQALVLEGSSAGWYFNTGNGYLYAASSSNNYLKTKTTTDDNTKAVISISGINATITFQGSNTRNSLRYNSSDNMFSCYTSSSTMKKVQLYKKVETVDVTVTAGGALGEKFYATYSNAEKALDFSAVEGLTAYVVASSPSENSIALTEVTKVPAGTAVLVEGDAAATYQVPVVSTANAITTNFLKVADSNTVGDGQSIYILTAGNKGVGFYPVRANSRIPEGKVYLEIPNGEAKSFISLFGDDANAISSMEAVQNSGVIYNLNGQRVAAPVKGGLYIMNGKKVLVK